jgi:hypothetical protein
MICRRDHKDRNDPLIPSQTRFASPIGGEHVSNLLWALESLAWSPRYLGRVCSVIAKLAARDPAGRYGNRPANSLRNIFLLWLPQTFAPLDDRFRVLDLSGATEAAESYPTQSRAGCAVAQSGRFERLEKGTLENTNDIVWLNK